MKEIFVTLFMFYIQPGYSLRNFVGHSASVMSLDFHPNKDDVICSCDGDGEIRYWSINNGSCSRVFKVGSYLLLFDKLGTSGTFFAIRSRWRLKSCGQEPVGVCVISGKGKNILSFDPGLFLYEWSWVMVVSM